MEEGLIRILRNLQGLERWDEVRLGRIATVGT